MLICSYSDEKNRNFVSKIKIKNSKITEFGWLKTKLEKKGENGAQRSRNFYS